MFQNARLLARLWWRPAAGMSGILDRGSLLFASVAALATSLLLRFNVRPLAFSFYTPLLVLAAVYVPGTLLVAGLIGRLGGFRTVFARDYAPLLTCAAMAWAAAGTPLALTARVVPLPVFLALAALACLYFAVLMFFAVRTVLGTTNGVAAGTVALSWIPLAAVVVFREPLSFFLGWLASPFFLLFAFYYLGHELSNLGAGLRRRQNFRRMLEASALNPHDAGAQYQLGLIYQQRRLYTEAIERFKNAVAIDPKETDAHFQLGRIAREQGRLNDALACFQAVLDQDEKHSQNEILREIGAMYLAARQYEDARRELAAYIEQRPYDPEGLYYYGQALEGLGKAADARAMYARAIEAARTAPSFRRRETARWSRLAQKQARKLG
ncbi:MAG: tetratricopeptide repeat protein [Bryobacteraceae bacterium]|jgi:tetratricopeptide (TPR) repeat protein